jgi:hypothetical protein
MALQNRVDPWGRLHAVNARGTMLGNRGRLHNEHRQIVRQWQRLAWVACELQFSGRCRDVFGANTYSELFFLDEATALSAGHRPCATCRRARYEEFKGKWLVANSTSVSIPGASIIEIDKVLNRERADRSGEKVTFDAPLSTVPLGAFVEINGEAFLVWRRGLARWSFSGYSVVQIPFDPSVCVRVLTPQSVVRTLVAGFLPTVHSSVNE